jgi:hypothetical protein
MSLKGVAKNSDVQTGIAVVPVYPSSALPSETRIEAHIVGALAPGEDAGV